MTPVRTVILTEEQKKLALESYPTMDHATLTRTVFNNPKLDSRSAEGKILKVFLAGEKLEPKVIDHRADGQPYVLDADQCQFIENNVRAFRGKTLELARVVAKNEKLTPLSKEFRAIYAHLKEVYPEAINSSDEPVEELEYRLPATVQSLVTVVNDYVTTGDMNRKPYKWGQLKPSEDRCLRKLMAYLRVFRFTYQTNQYDKKADRELFISTFIRFSHDKPDLTEIEVDQTISAAAETVNIAQIERSIKRIDKIQEDIMAGCEVDNDGKVKKLGMSDVELINAVRSKHDTAKNRLKILMEGLEQTRSKRESGKNERNSSVLNLLESWQNDERKRADMIAMGDREKAEDLAEIGRLSDLDDLTALISGQTKEEAAE